MFHSYTWRTFIAERICRSVYSHSLVTSFNYDGPYLAGQTWVDLMLARGRARRSMCFHCDFTGRGKTRTMQMRDILQRTAASSRVSPTKTTAINKKYLYVRLGVSRRNFFRDHNVYWTCFADVNNIGVLPDTSRFLPANCRRVIKPLLYALSLLWRYVTHVYVNTSAMRIPCSNVTLRS